MEVWRRRGSRSRKRRNGRDKEGEKDEREKEEDIVVYRQKARAESWERVAADCRCLVVFGGDWWWKVIAGTVINY